MSEHDVLPGERGKEGVEVIQDETSTFAALLAIYFPAVTGIFTGTNMSGKVSSQLLRRFDIFKPNLQAIWKTPNDQFPQEL